MIAHLVTDRQRLCPGAPFDEARRCLAEQARQAIEAGVDVIQVRERDLEAAALAAVVGDLVRLRAGHATKVVVNDRLDVALACGADGVHLRSDSIPAEAVRRVAPGGFMVGQSVHGVEEGIAAGPVDYLLAGTVYATPSKPGQARLIGPSTLRAIARAVSVPVLAIGGIVPSRLAEVAAAGAAGVAGIGLFIDSSPGAGRCRATRIDLPAIRRVFDTPRPPF